jgi:hypothetical protein
MPALTLIFAEIDRRLGALASVHEYERMPSGDPAAYPALHVYDNGDEPIEAETDTSRLQLAITVEGYVEGEGGATTHDEMIELHSATVAALCADDGALGGLVELIEIAGQRRVQLAPLAETRRIAFAQDFTIQFATVRGDPAQFA